MTNPTTLTTSVCGPLQARVAPVLDRLAKQRVVERIWDKDAGLWSQDPTVQRAIRNRLGWLSIAPVMEARVEEILGEATRIKDAGFTRALLLGMGGSSLFADVCRYTFGVAPGWLDLAVLDSTDPRAITDAAQQASLARTLIIVSSKSGATTESHTLGDYFYGQFRALTNERAGDHCLAITDAGTPLETLAAQRGFRRAFVHGPTTGQDVGGRFSALTCFGLVPAALMGVDIRRLLARAQEMLAGCAPTIPLANNPAAQLGACLGEAAASGRDKITLLCAKPLARFGVWVEQLVAESTGKSGQGLIPIDGEPLQDAAAYGSDRLFVELQLATEPDAALAGAVEALIKAGLPVVQLQWRDRDDLGAEVIRWFVATAVAGWLMQINPFDEPNVQESKDRTNALLARYAREGGLADEPPLFTDQLIHVYGDPAQTAGRSLDEALQHWLKQIGPGDYVAVASFLPRTPALDEAAQVLRRRLAQVTGAATMLGFGPRYLHSTGQLHKGGPDRVVLLFLTAEDALDVTIPGKPYPFGVLKQAQALGDYQALRERHRRMLRLHLGQAPDAGLARLLSLLQPRPQTQRPSAASR